MKRLHRMWMLVVCVSSLCCYMYLYIEPLSVVSTVIDWTHRDMYTHISGVTSMYNLKGSDLPPCPQDNKRLIGEVTIDLRPISWHKLNYVTPYVYKGRHWSTECRSAHQVAIIIPYRAREEHLKSLLNNLHPMLYKQQLDYGIYVVEEAWPTKFNRAMLFNIGYTEAIKQYPYNCFVFHDVDYIPENDHNIYSCTDSAPRHMAQYAKHNNYKRLYRGYVGAVLAFTRKQFESVNGFSNKYFGWGHEDDDMSVRIKARGYIIRTEPVDIGRYTSFKHTRDKGNEEFSPSISFMSTIINMRHDGLNSLHNYSIISTQAEHTHILIKVSINGPW